MSDQTLAQILANRVAGIDNQHAIVMIVGSGGTGKSYWGLDLAQGVAEEIVKLRGGQPKDYFDIDKTLAIINRKEIKRIMTNPGKLAIIDLDDIGVGWNARKYKDDFNIFLNDIIQTFRPNNNLVIMTLQSSFLIDRVPRSLAHYLVEMEEAIFSKGITIAKVFKIKIKHRDGVLHYEYLTDGRKKLLRFVGHKPPQDICDRYEIKRAEQLKIMMTDREDEENAKGKGKEETKKSLILRMIGMGMKKEDVIKASDCTNRYYSDVIKSIKA